MDRQAIQRERQLAGVIKRGWGMAGTSQPDGAGGAGLQCYLALLCLELGVWPGSLYHCTWYSEFDKGGGPGVQGFDERI